MNGPFRGVVFDLDGVLADSEDLHVEAWKLTLQRLGVAWEQVPLDQWVGVPDVRIVDQAVIDYRIPLTPARLLQRKRVAFRDLVARKLRPFEGVREELAALDSLPLGLATASPRRETELMLRVMGLRKLFRATVTGDDVRNPKPHPETYLTAARRIRVEPGDCVAVEDSPVGLRSALQAGLAAVAVANTYPPEKLAEAQKVFATTAQAIRWIGQRLAAAGPG